MKIAFFDSGVGGLTVLHQALHSLPNEEYLYYGDVDHVPYGEKSKEEIIGYVDHAVKFMLTKNVKAIVVVCNTATSVAIGTIRQKYRDIPILGIEPAVKPAIEETDGKRIMVVATPVTVREKRLKDLLDRFDEDRRVDMLALPGLVRFAEREVFEGCEVDRYLKDRFGGYDLTNYAALVLGCTHFNYFKDTFHRMFPQTVRIIDGNAGTVRHLAKVLSERDLLGHSRQSVEYYCSGRILTKPEQLCRIEKYLRRLDEMEKY